MKRNTSMIAVLSLLFLRYALGGLALPLVGEAHGGEPEASAPTPPPGDYRPNDTTYRARYLTRARIKIDGVAGESEWSKANVEKRFSFPWNSKTPAPATEFRAMCDDAWLYVTFRAEDADIVLLDKLRDKEDAVFEDRVEMIFSRDRGLKDYRCLEIDSRGRVFDYRAAFYRRFDSTWSWPGIEAAGSTFKGGYVVELRIPAHSFETLGLGRLRPGARVLWGLYRAEFSHDRSGRRVVQRETLHNRGRKVEGPPPLEDWMSWIDPKTPEPDFHVPSSLGWLEIVE